MPFQGLPPKTHENGSPMSTQTPLGIKPKAWLAAATMILP